MAGKKENSDKAGPDGNVDQIREILFGGHLRAFDERFELVESRLAKETDALRKATDKKFQDLERLAAEIRDDAGDRLGAETNNRELALNKFELALFPAKKGKQSVKTFLGAIGSINRITFFYVNQTRLGSIFTGDAQCPGAGVGAD